MSALSREARGAVSNVGLSARADKTSSRLVSDFEPGRETVAFSGALETGAGQGWEYVVEVIGF
jgi:hypothetical protein